MADEPITIETLMARFQYDLASFEKAKSDLTELTTTLEDKMKGFNRRIADDTKKMAEAHGASMEGMKKSTKDFGAVMEEVSNALGVNFAKFATYAGITMSAVAALDFMRKSVHDTMQMESMFSGAHQESAVMGGQLRDYTTRLTSPMLTGMTYGGVTGVERTEALKVAGILASTPGMEAGNILGMGGIAEQALTMGRTTGLGSEKTAQMFSDMVRKMEVPAERVAEVFTGLFEKGKLVDNVNGDYIQTTMRLANALKAYNIDLDATSEAVKKFWHDIDKGRISVEDLSKAFTMVRSTTEGQKAFIGAEILGMGGMDAITAMMRTEKVLQGGYFTMDEHGRMKPPSEAEKQEQGRAMQSIYQWADKQAQQIAKNDEQLQFYREKFLGVATGFNFANLPQDVRQRLFKAFESGEITPGVQTDLMTARRTEEARHLFEIGNTLIRLEKGPLQRIMELTEALVGIVGAGLLYLPSFVMPKGARESLESYIMYNVPGMKNTEMGGKSAISWESTPEVSSYTELGSISNLAKVNPQEAMNRLTKELTGPRGKLSEQFLEGRLNVNVTISPTGKVEITPNGEFMTIENWKIHTEKQWQGIGNLMGGGTPSNGPATSRQGKK